MASTFISKALRHAVFPEPVQTHFASRPQFRNLLASNRLLSDEAFEVAYTKKVPADVAVTLNRRRLPTDRSVAAVVASRERRVTPLEAILSRPLTDKQCLMLADLAVPETVADQVLDEARFPLQMQLLLFDRASAGKQFRMLAGRSSRLSPDVAHDLFDETVQGLHEGSAAPGAAAQRAAQLLYHQPTLAEQFVAADVRGLLRPLGELGAAEAVDGLVVFADKLADEYVNHGAAYHTARDLSRAVGLLLMHPSVPQQQVDVLSELVETHEFVQPQKATNRVVNMSFGGPFGLPDAPRLGVRIPQMDTHQLQQVLQYVTSSDMRQLHGDFPLWLLVKVGDNLIGRAEQDLDISGLLPTYVAACYATETAFGTTGRIPLTLVQDRVLTLTGVDVAGRSSSAVTSDLDIEVGAQVSRSSGRTATQPERPDGDVEAGADVLVNDQRSIWNRGAREATQALHDAVAYLTDQFGHDLALWDMAFTICDASFGGTAEQLATAANAGASTC